jgi:eukaryotic-like serine/threonine-protein kinase
MGELLQPGQVIYTDSSQLPCRIERFLGGGNQGEVYQADLLGRKVAIKWYFPHFLNYDLRLQDRIKTAIEIGTPSEQFLWPMELVTAHNAESFGYIMPLRSPLYKGFNDLMRGKIDPSFRAIATAGIELSDSFYKLHAKGLCYCEISFGNIFFNPETGNILICDNDNVDFNNTNPGSVLGTPRFMAPEIVRRQSRPSIETDLFSLAVLLFYMFMIHHPLEGQQEAAIKNLDAQAMTYLYGTHPVFIFDPNNDSNRPVEEYHQTVIEYWQIYPQFLRDLFIKAFTQGIHIPNRRVQETEWRLTMIRLRDSILYCPYCRAENFYVTSPSSPSCPRCWNPTCRQEIPIPPQLRIEHSTMFLNYDTELFPHHLNNRQSYDFSQPSAVVTQHPTIPNLWGLRNLTKEYWTITKKNGDVKLLEPGHSLMLEPGIRINFGSKEGKIF